MKKKLFLAAIVAAGFCSCDNQVTGTYEELNAGTNEIKIAPYTGSSLITKGLDQDESYLETNGFYAWARNNGSTIYKEENLFRLNGDFDGTEGIYGGVTNGKWYWPVTGSLDFFAYNDIVHDVYVANSSDLSFATGEPTFNFVTKTTAADQTDPLVVYKENVAKTIPVGLNFYHALSKVSATVSFDSSTPADFQLKITSITINDVVIDGECTVKNAGTVPTWSFTSTVSDMDFTLAGIDNLTTSATPTNQPVHDATNSFLVIPQKITQMTLAYEWYDISGTTPLLVEDCVTTKKVLTSGFPAMVANSHYTFNFTITPKVEEITFTVDEVVGWDPVGVVDLAVPQPLP